MKINISSGRLNYQPVFTYQDGVLIGNNWYEERNKYVKDTHKHDTTYNTDFTPKKANDITDEVWSNIIKGEGVDRQLLMDHEGDKYYENYSATTDLVYHWLPHCKKPYRHYSTTRLLFLPEQDLALNYGNVTNFNLRKQKKIQWNYENLTDSTSWTTENKDNFLKPPPESYTIQRKAIPKIASSKIFPLNKVFNDLPLRGEKVSLLPEFPLAVQKRKYPHFYY